MTTFEDGPARSQRLLLQRSPRYLRVTHDPQGGTWDALDAPDDEPGPHEALYAYRLVKRGGTYHIDYTERGRRRGLTVPIACYALVVPQPPELVLRSAAAWRQWCQAAAERRGARPGPVEQSSEV